MQQLVVVAPDGKTWTVAIEEEGDTIIGREPGLPVVLDSPQVSRKHARLFWLGDSFWIEDLGSSNGVLVDDAAIAAPARLSLGKPFVIGGFRLSLAPTGAASRPRYQLAGRSEPCLGRAIGLPMGSLDVGRGNNVGIPIEHSSISRRHAVISVKADGVTVEDAGSSNGTWVNGQRVERGFLSNGDEVRFGSVSFMLEPYRSSMAEGELRYRREQTEPSSRVLPKIIAVMTMLVAVGAAYFYLAHHAASPGARGKRPSITGLAPHETKGANANNAMPPGGINKDATPGDSNNDAHADANAQVLKVSDANAVAAADPNAAPTSVVQPEPTLADEAPAPTPGARSPSKAHHRSATPSWLPRWFVRWRSEPGALGKEEVAYEQALTEQLTQAQTQAQNGSWPLAAATYAAILRVDPLNDQALQGQEQAEQALETQQVIAMAQQAMAQNQPGRAFSVVSSLLARGVDDTGLGVIADRARYSIAQHCATDANDACLARKYPQCQTQAVCALAYQPRDPSGWALLEEAENGMRSKGIKYTPYSGATANRAALLDQYPDDKVRDAMLRYATGDAATALQRLRGAGKKAKAPLAGIATVTHAQTTGDEAVNANDIPRAITSWVEALSADKQLLPQGQPDVVGYMLHRKVGKELLQQGERAFNRGQYVDAFTAWNQGLQLEPDNQDLGDAMDKLESRATRLLEALNVGATPDAAVCGRLKDVIAITRPEFPAHKDAVVRAEKCAAK